MKHILFLSLIFAALIANAQEFQARIREEEDPNLRYSIHESQTQAQAIEDCANCSTNNSLAPQAVATLQETAEHLDRINENEWANKCTEFINNGAIGPYGHLIRSEIMKPNKLLNIKRGDTDLTSICPSYAMMDDSSKANVFALIMTAMAFEESTCSNDRSARGPNGTANGFFQLHLGREASYGPECNNYDSRTPEGSITCALSMINKQMGEGHLFRQESNYWDVLRPKRYSRKNRSYFNNPSYAEIRSAISEFGPCLERQSSVQPADENMQLYQVMHRKIFHKKVENEPIDL